MKKNKSKLSAVEKFQEEIKEALENYHKQVIAESVKKALENQRKKK